MNSIGVCTFATNEYLEYWEAQLQSWISSKVDLSRIRFHIFTNRDFDAKHLKEKYCDVEIVIYKIEDLKWPEITALRYKIIKRHFNNIIEDILVFIDADMLIVEDISSIFIPKSENFIYLVRHPGYFRGKFLNRLAYFTKRTSFISDLKMFFKIGGIGAWETSKLSTAYVPKLLRRRYFCGGFWFGSNNEFKKLVSDLDYQTDVDIQSNFGYPIWHDESHLNKWAVKNRGRFRQLDPSYCFDPNYANLKGLKPRVIAVSKTK